MILSSEAFALGTARQLWEVFLLFTIPWGGGIPAGVVLGQKYALGWVTLSWLYFLSDICLALVFEPLMLGFIHITRDNSFFIRLREELRKNTLKTIQKFGSHPNAFNLVLVAFGVDPMTGRAAAKAAGHGFITGWMIAITGDMFYFWVLMISTIWLNRLIGNAWVTVILVIVLALVIPRIFEKAKSIFSGKKA